MQKIAAAGLTFTKARTTVETVSGNAAVKEHKGFAKLLDKLEAGHVLIVTKPVRLGRNAMGVRAPTNRWNRPKCACIVWRSAASP